MSLLLKDLPIEILTIVATQDLEMFLLCLKVPKLGTLLCDSYAQITAKAKFVSVIESDNKTIYYLDGVIHRRGGPAIEWKNGDKEWRIKGVRHREDGPALEVRNNTRAWYKDGLLHRENGPAIEWFNGGKEWRIKGVLHREGGPAREFSNGKVQWWINGKVVDVL